MQIRETPVDESTKSRLSRQIEDFPPSVFWIILAQILIPILISILYFAVHLPPSFHTILLDHSPFAFNTLLLLQRKKKTRKIFHNTGTPFLGNPIFPFCFFVCFRQQGGHSVKLTLPLLANLFTGQFKVDNCWYPKSFLISTLFSFLLRNYVVMMTQIVY